MKKRASATSKKTKARRRSTAAPKRRTARAVSRRSLSGAGQETELARLNRERDEVLEQLAGATEVLKVISSSAGDLKPVFDTILENATRICEAKFGNLWLREGDTFRIAATHGAPPAYREYFDREPVVHPQPRSGLGLILKTKQLIHIADIKTEPTFKDKMRIATIELANGRSLVGVPLLKENEVVGAIVIYRQEVRPFTEKQIALLQNFAAQAVIAIENTRLLNELRQSLERQTATAEVLGVISSSPGRLEPVFQSMLDNAVRICEAKFGFMNRYDGNAWKIYAVHGAVPAYIEFLQQHGYKRPGPETVVARIAATRQVVHIADLAASRGYAERDPIVVAAVELGGVRTILGVPMLKEGELIGAVILYRQEARPFTDKQIALVTSFAAQAVIAIENARLLNELRHRRRAEGH
jgi:GAF domain-containing protein